MGIQGIKSSKASLSLSRHTRTHTRHLFFRKEGSRRASEPASLPKNNARGGHRAHNQSLRRGVRAAPPTCPIAMSFVQRGGDSRFRHHWFDTIDSTPPIHHRTAPWRPERYTDQIRRCRCERVVVICAAQHSRHRPPRTRQALRERRRSEYAACCHHNSKPHV